MIHKATDRILERYLIIHLVYLSNNEKNPHVTRIVEFLALQNGTTKSMYEVVIGLLKKHIECLSTK